MNIRAIKIDSENRTITEIEISSKRDQSRQLEDMQVVVKGFIGLAHYYPDQKSCCFINDDGLLINPQHFFLSKYYPNPLAGNGIICGYKNEYTVSCTLSLQQVIDTTEFLTLQQVQELIRLGVADFNSYIITQAGKELLTRRDLGAFD